VYYPRDTTGQSGLQCRRTREPELPSDQSLDTGAAARSGSASSCSPAASRRPMRIGPSRSTSRCRAGMSSSKTYSSPCCTIDGGQRLERAPTAKKEATS
jgi:hypothetical protein